MGEGPWRAALEQGQAWDAGCEPVSLATRGEAVEEVHRGVVTVAAADGSVLGGVGDPAVRVLLRSAAKPFQALALLESGGHERFELSDEELAVVCASHSGGPGHVRVVAGLLARLGAGPDDLACGVQAPLDARARLELEARGEAPTPLHNTCSGKHAGMIALALTLGAPIAGYQDPDHPVQRRIAEVVASRLGVEAHDVLVGVDGCGVPVVSTTAAQAAALYARLAEGASPALARLRDAMVAHPLLVAGEGRFDTVAMTAAAGRLVAKGGASGVQCLGLPAAAGRSSVGVLIKLGDGGTRGLPVVAAEVLGAWDLGDALPAMDAVVPRVVRTVAGAEAGRVLPVVGSRQLRHRPRGAAGSEGAGDLEYRVDVDSEDDRDVLRFLRREWPRADQELLGRTYDWRAERLVLVARRRRRAIAVLRGHVVGGVATVNELLVGEDVRGRGVGSRLLRAFEAEARARGCHKVALRTPEGSRAETFYRAHGFHREYLLPGHHFGQTYAGMSKRL